MQDNKKKEGPQSGAFFLSMCWLCRLLSLLAAAAVLPVQELPELLPVQELPELLPVQELPELLPPPWWWG
jgi:hypothetical protein